jgi:hypothetical protein
LPRKLSRAQRLVATIGGAVCLAGALPGVAMAAECPVQPTSKAFAEFGDTNDYYLAPGGAFESLSWERIGSVALNSDNDPFDLAPGLFSAQLDSGESISASFCVDHTMPHLRFVAKRRSGQQLDVTVKTVFGGSIDTSSGTLAITDAYESWTPTGYISLKTGAIPAGESGTATVTMRSSGTWRVDNVFLDPYRR